jgi:cytoskeleton protein RodZ
MAVTQQLLHDAPVRLERETFGSVLRAARERRGLSLHDLARATNVPAALWHALESSDLAFCSDPADTTTHIHQYASAVGLDPDQIVDQFRRLLPQRTGRVEQLLRSHPTLVRELE